MIDALPGAFPRQYRARAREGQAATSGHFVVSTDPLALAVGRAVLKRFRERNADRRAQGERLEAAIREIDEAHIGPAPLRAEAILALLPRPRELGRKKPPSLRTLQRHLQAIESETAAAQKRHSRSAKKPAALQQDEALR